MKTLRRKLHSNSGASLMVALLYFIVCAVVGSVIIAAASTSMGRMKNLRQSDKEREMLESATRLVVDGLTRNEQLFDDADAKSYNKTNPADNKVTENKITWDKDAHTLISEISFSFLQTGDNSYHWNSVQPLTAGREAPTTEPDADGDVWKWEMWPTAPQPSASSRWPNTLTSGDADASYTISKDQAKTLTEYRNVRADNIISYYWGLNGIATDDSHKGSRYLLKGWKKYSLPSNQSWRYGHQTDYDSEIKAGRTPSKTDNDPINSLLKKQQFQLSVTGKTDAPDQVYVDLFMDQYLNMEAQIYPVSKEYYTAAGSEGDPSFYTAPMRYLVRIPAKTGEVRYIQQQKSEHYNNLKVASWEVTLIVEKDIKDDADNVIDTVEEQVKADSLGRTNYIITNDDYQKLMNNELVYASVPSEYDSKKVVGVLVDVTKATDVLSTTVTRKVLLSDFGWNKDMVEIYTGATVDAAGPTPKDQNYMTWE